MPIKDSELIILKLMRTDPLYHVYVLQNSVGSFYIGLSNNFHKRQEDHNSGVSRWTRSRGPWSIVWFSRPMNLSHARILENKLKRQKGGNGFFAMTGLQPKVKKTLS